MFVTRDTGDTIGTLLKFIQEEDKDHDEYFVKVLIGHLCFLKALDLITGSSELIDRLAANTKLFRTRMGEAGFNVLVSSLP